MAGTKIVHPRLEVSVKAGLVVLRRPSSFTLFLTVTAARELAAALIDTADEIEPRNFPSAEQVVDGATP